MLRKSQINEYSDTLPNASQTPNMKLTPIAFSLRKYVLVFHVMNHSLTIDFSLILVSWLVQENEYQSSMSAAPPQTGRR